MLQTANCCCPLPTFLTGQEYRDKGQGKTKGVGFGKLSDAKRGNADDADGADKKRIKKCRRCRLTHNYCFLWNLVKFRMQKGGTRMTRMERIKKE